MPEVVHRLKLVVPLVIAIRIAAFAAGAIAVKTVGFVSGPIPPPTASNVVLDLPARWDTGWYIGVAHGGYRWNGRMDQYQNIAFFPAWPLAFRYFAKAVGAGSHPVAWMWAGVALSTVFFVSALVMLSRLTDLEAGREHSRAAVILAACYPFAIFFGLPYSESLFLLCLVGAFERLRSGALLTASAFGLIAGLTRPNGWLVAIPLLLHVVGVERWLAPRTTVPTTHSRWMLLVVGMSPIVGVLLYSAYVHSVTGHPLAWAQVQDAWGRGLQNPVTVVWSLVAGAVGPDAPKVWTERWIDLVNLAAILFALAAVLPVSRRFGAAYGLLVFVGTFGPLVGGGVASGGRYSSVLFPLYMWLAVAAPRSWPAIATIFLAGQLAVAAMFFTWRAIY